MDNKQDQFAEYGRISGLAYDAPGINPDPNVEKRTPKGYSLMDQVRMRQGLCECRILPRARPGTGGGVERWNAA